MTLQTTKLKQHQRKGVWITVSILTSVVLTFFALSFIQIVLMK